ncbi:MAG: winged helix-turn-helix transcriptional regulator [Candidatus Lokiarchaeota archaeon]|nr:winged helix-turn-helix transcriptional regulator [Candidatus Lokiarchaeota archaeon]
MFTKNPGKHYPAKQKEILKVLLEGPLQQKDLAARVGISGAGLFYHIEKLEAARLITRKILAEVGNVSLKEVSVHPNAVQWAREITGTSLGRNVLLCAFGTNTAVFGESSRMPATAKKFLEDQGYKIDRIVAFVTPDSSLDKARELVTIDKVFSYPYNDYRDDDSELMQSLSRFIQDEQKEADVFIDVTGLTKLLTIRLVELSTIFNIPCFYLGKKSDDQDFLLWLNR